MVRTTLSRLEHVWGPWVALGLAGGAVALAAEFRNFSVTGALLCLLAVSLVAQTFGILLGLVTVGACSVLLYLHVFPLNPYLIPPVSTMAFVLVSSTFCLLQGRLPAARKSESQALALVDLSRALSEAATEAQVWAVLDHHLEKEFGPLTLLRAGAAWKSGSEHWVPMPDELGRVGLVKEPEEKELLEAFLRYAAQSLGRLRLARKLSEAELMKAREKLYHALLDSISHDLRIPLVSITGVLSSLLEESFPADEETRKDLLENALSEAGRLQRLVENLLQMTRLEAGALKVSKKPYDMSEVVSAVLDSLGPQLAGRALELDVPDELPMVPQDSILIGQVLRNLFDNALKYSPPGSPLILRVRLESGQVSVSLLDSGKGLSPDEQNRAFEKFFRGEVQRVHGSGLGLSICEGLVGAHGGDIRLRARPELEKAA